MRKLSRFTPKWMYYTAASGVVLSASFANAQDDWQPSDRSRGDLARYELNEFAAPADKGVVKDFKFPGDANDGIYGIDVSHHNGPINWVKIAAGGAKFVYIKSSEGAGFKDKRFVDNWKGAGAQSTLRRGAYHFLSAGIPAKTQADNFLAQLKASGGLGKSDLAPVLDIEWDFTKVGGKDVDRWAKFSSADIVAAAAEWLEIVKKATGRTPIVYTARSWWSGRVGPNEGLIAYPHWTADYRHSSLEDGVPLKVPKHESRAWQFTDAAKIDGIINGVDANKLSVDSLDKMSGN